MAELSHREQPYCTAVFELKRTAVRENGMGAEEKEDRAGYEMQRRVTDRGSTSTVPHRCSIMVSAQALGMRKSRGLAPL